MTIRTAFLAIALALSMSAPAQDSKLATATFAGGCFWCMEEAFDKVPGVVSTISGYMGGTKKLVALTNVTSFRGEAP